MCGLKDEEMVAKVFQILFRGSSAGREHIRTRRIIGIDMHDQDSHSKSSIFYKQRFAFNVPSRLTVMGLVDRAATVFLTKDASAAASSDSVPKSVYNV